MQKMKIAKWCCIFLGIYLLVECFNGLPFVLELPTLLLPETRAQFLSIHSDNGSQDILFDTRPDCVQTSYNFSAYSQLPALTRTPILNRVRRYAQQSLAQFFPVFSAEVSEMPLSHYFSMPRPRLLSRKPKSHTVVTKKNAFYRFPNYTQVGAQGLPYKIFH